MSNLKKSLSYSAMVQFIIRNEKEARDLFFKKNLTARQLAEHFKIVFNPNWQKACFRQLGSKKMGHGGARPGAGNFKENRESRRNKKREFEIITVGLPPEAIQVLKSIGGTYSNAISQALLSYQEKN